jgi:GT2 family glycosyltransferase
MCRRTARVLRVTPSRSLGMPAALELSVVIPTHNRRPRLLRLLESLRDGTLAVDRFEVIVVADDCTDDTVAALAATSLPFAVRVLEQTPGCGAATARNAGAKVARGPVVVFVDDDIEPFPSMLAVHAAAHADARENGAEPLVMVGAPVPMRASDAGFHELAVWGWWEQELEQMAEPSHRFTYDEVFTGILSIPAALFADVGGFETSLPYSCRDDSELGWRLIRRGARIAFSRAGGGYHHEMRSRASLLERKRAEGSADAMMARLHPELWPVLRLSLPLIDRRLRGFPRLAFAARWLGTPLTVAACTVLDLFERLRMRGFWRRLNAAVMYYQYWRGVATFLGARDALGALADSARAVEESKPAARELAIDLCRGVTVAADAIDEARPDALRVLVAGREVGRIPPRIGAEPLRGRHLAPLLVRHLGEPITTALALEDLLSRPTARRDP